MSQLKSKNIIAAALVISLISALSGCGSSNEFQDLSVNSDYKSFVFTQSSDNKNKTVTKMIVTLRNTGKKPVYVNGKFVFSILTVANQIKGKGLLRKIPAQEMTFFSSSGSWTSVNEVFEAIDPYTESKFIVAISLPNNTYIEDLLLVNREDSKVQNIGRVRFYGCPYSGGASLDYWSSGKKCQNGKLV